MKIPFKSKLTKKTIELNNEAFEKFSKTQQRKEIAYDALMLIVKGIATTLSGGYWGEDLHNIKDASLSSSAFQCNLLKIDEKTNCSVCQKGLMMLSQIRLSNSLHPADSGITNGSHKGRKGFSENAFDQMEEDFEGWSRAINTTYKPGSSKLQANICCNVIANGDYKPKDETDYIKKWGIIIPE